MRQPRAATRFALTGLLSVTVGVSIAIIHPANAAPPAATFSAPLILLGGGAEPSIRIPNDGKSAAYVSAPNSLGSHFWRVTEKTNPDASITFIQSPVQQPDLGTGGGDSEISVGDSPPGTSCDTIAYSGLHNADIFDNFTTAVSKDCGKTFSTPNLYATQHTLTDRQWQVFDGKRTNYLLYHKVDTNQIVVSKSFDGGLTYLSLSPGGATGVIDATTAPKVANQVQIGNVAVDHSQPTGTTNFVGDAVHVMYAVFSGPVSVADDAQAQIDSAVPGGGYNHNDTIYIGKSTDGGLTWTDTQVVTVDPSTKRELNMLFPVVSIDKAGNIYVVWADTFKVEYAVSTDHGATWSKPYQVNNDNHGASPDPGKADVFPWIAAGADGLLDVVWYHGEGGAANSNLPHRDPGDVNTRWTVAFAQLGNATNTNLSGAADPTVLTYSDAVTPPIHYGDICQNGTFCSPVPGAPVFPGDRSLLDFFEVAIDQDGRANVALADNADAPGAYITAYIRQTSGYSLTTGHQLPVQTVTAPTLECPADGSFVDPPDDANDVLLPGGSPLPSAPALDITKGSFTYDGKAVTFHIAVKDLSQDPPSGSTGEQFEFAFAKNKTTFFAVASHEATSGDSFHMESPLRTGVGDPLTGTFDTAKSEVRIVVPSTWFGTLDPKQTGFSTSEKITGLGITSRRNIANAVVPNADEATTLCPYIVRVNASTGGGSGSGSGVTVPAPSDNRPIPGTGGLATTGLRSEIPIVAGVLLLGAAFIARRSRRT
jgi:hypothetical protein